MGVYGTFLDSFPELFEKMTACPPKTVDWRNIRGVFLPKGGNSVTRRKVTSGTWIGDLASGDYLFVTKRYEPETREGWSIKYKGDTYTVIKRYDYLRSGGFIYCELERQQGATMEQGADLHIKRGSFS